MQTSNLVVEDNEELRSLFLFNTCINKNISCNISILVKNKKEGVAGAYDSWAPGSGKHLSKIP